jgi:hypothetical protein
MGVELLEVDERFRAFFEKEFIEVLATYLEMCHGKAQVSRDADFLIIPCEECNARNKIPKEKINLKPRCGKCGSLLHL